MQVNGKLLYSAVLLLLTHFCRGQYKMLAPSQPIVAAVGSTVVLPCQLEPIKNLQNSAVEWARRDLRPRFVHIRRDGIDFLIDQNSLYLGRTALSDRKLNYGDMSLELSRVKLSDEGTYRCFVPQMDTGSEVQLLVASVSSPSISFTKDPSGAVVLQCESGGWYPEPELSWLDSEGNAVSAGRTVSLRAQDELYSVSSRITVEQSSTFTCRVSESSTKQSRETQIHVADAFLVGSSCSVARVFISLGACLFATTAVIMFVWKLSKAKTVSADPEIGEREAMIKMAEKRQSLDAEQCFEEQQRIENELEYVQNVIKNLTETKKDLMNNRETLNRWMHQIKLWIDQEKRRSFGLMTKDKKKKEQSKFVEELEITHKEYEKMIKDIDKQLKTTEEMILKTTERKGKLERDKEHIYKLLKELKKRKEEAARAETEPLFEENEEKTNNESEPQQTHGIQAKETEDNDESKTGDEKSHFG